MALVAVSTGPVEAKGLCTQNFQDFIALSGYMQDMHVHIYCAQSFLNTGIQNIRRLSADTFSSLHHQSSTVCLTLTTGHAEVAWATL